MRTGCEFYGDALVDLAAGSLEPGRADRVRAHVAECRECREALQVIQAVRTAPAPVPEGLESRLQTAVLDAAGRGSATSPVVGKPVPEAWDRGSRWTVWRRLSLPLAAAAAVALWFGANQVLTPVGSVETGSTVEVTGDYDPYGALPGEDGEVAGDLVLSQLSVEELEALLEEMQS